MQTFTLTVGDGIASLFDNEEPNDPPLVEGFGPTNDEAFLDLCVAISAHLTFDGKDA